MNTELYNNWIEALDTYKYTRAELRNTTTPDCFCCLGVLCDIYDPNQWVQKKDVFAYGAGPYAVKGSLPNVLVEQLQLKSGVGHFNLEDLSVNLQNEIRKYTIPRNPVTLTYLNDTIPDPFPIIQRILKERPPSLFNTGS